MSEPKEEEHIDVHAVFVGDGSVGKTSLLAVLKGLPFPREYVPTTYDNYIKKVENPNGETKDIKFYDTAGQQDYYELRQFVYSGAHSPHAKTIFCIAFALNNAITLGNIEEVWLPELSHQIYDNEKILLGLKSDLREALNPEHISTEKAQKFCQDHNIKYYIECSSKTGNGVDQVFQKMIEISNIPTKKKICYLL